MKNVAAIILALLAVSLATHAHAAGPKYHSHGANRVGPYITAHVGMTGYKGEQQPDEDRLMSFFSDPTAPPQNVSASSDDSDIGYAIAFGYRFDRYAALELGLSRW